MTRFQANPEPYLILLGKQNASLAENATRSLRHSCEQFNKMDL